MNEARREVYTLDAAEPNFARQWALARNLGAPAAELVLSSFIVMLVQRAGLDETRNWTLTGEFRLVADGEPAR